MMSDIGGLMQSLIFVASLLINWWSSFNAGLFLMRHLFVSTSNEFLKKRNTLPSADKSFLDERKDNAD